MKDFLRKVGAFIIKYNQFFVFPFTALCLFRISLYFFEDITLFSNFMYIMVIGFAGHCLFATIKLAISTVRQKRADKINKTLREGGEE